LTSIVCLSPDDHGAHTARNVLPTHGCRWARLAGTCPFASPPAIQHAAHQTPREAARIVGAESGSIIADIGISLVSC
jgi:hypothetical protein